MDKLYKNLGNVIKQHRLKKKLSTQELADILKVSTGLVNNIENGKTDAFNFGLLHNISETLEIPLLEMLIGDKMALEEVYPDIVNRTDLNNRHNKLNGETDLIRNYLDRISDAYLSALSVFEYDKGAIKRISEKILYEIEYIKGMKI